VVHRCLTGDWVGLAAGEFVQHFEEIAPGSVYQRRSVWRVPFAEPRSAVLRPQKFAIARVERKSATGGHSFPDIRPMDFERHSDSEFASKDGSLNANSGWRTLMACEASCRLGKDACFEIMPEMLNPVGFVADGVFPSNLGRTLSPGSVHSAWMNLSCDWGGNVERHPFILVHSAATGRRTQHKPPPRCNMQLTQDKSRTPACRARAAMRQMVSGRMPNRTIGSSRQIGFQSARVFPHASEFRLGVRRLTWRSLHP
jgi:hypothetical protein